MAPNSTILPVFNRNSSFRTPFAVNQEAAPSIGTPLPTHQHDSTVASRQDIHLGPQADTAIRGNVRTSDRGARSLWNWHPYIDRTIAVLGLAIGIVQFIRGLVDQKVAAAVSRFSLNVTHANVCTVRIRVELGRH